jgi:hypothetical protein
MELYPEKKGSELVTEPQEQFLFTEYGGQQVKMVNFTVMHLYSRRLPVASQVCMESRQLALSHFRVTKERLKDNRRRWEIERRAMMITWVHNDAAKAGHLMPLLNDHECIVLDLWGLRQGYGYGPSITLSSSILDFILAAKDHQIKVRHTESLVVKAIIDKLVRTKPYPQWTYKSARLVETYNISVIQDLARLHQTEVNRPTSPDDITQLSRNPLLLKAVVKRSLRPIHNLWRSTNRKRVKQGLPELPNLPKIDVVFSIYVNPVMEKFVSVNDVRHSALQATYSREQWDQALRSHGFMP